jgi:hypothetical protein
MTQYGEMGAWKAIRPASSNPYLFPGYEYKEPLTADLVRLRWHELRLILGITRLWNYDLRRTLACYLSNELHYDDVTIRAILNHYDGSALGHYCFKSFDSLTKPIQHYADWLCALTQESKGERHEPAPLPTQQVVLIPENPLPLRPLTAHRPSPPKRKRSFRWLYQGENATSWRGSRTASCAHSSGHVWGFLPRPSRRIAGVSWISSN